MSYLNYWRLLLIPFFPGVRYLCKYSSPHFDMHVRSMYRWAASKKSPFASGRDSESDINPL